jgi:hypothetical protein
MYRKILESNYLVLNLEVNSSGEDADDGPDSVQADELQAVLVDAEHHLQATSHRLDVLVVLQKKCII